jgi:hypothetical protein
LYDQFLRRIRRSGNTAQRVVNHLLLVADTIDELKLEALQDKDMTQRRLLKALNDEISRDAKARAGGVQPVLDDRRLPMVARLGRQADAPAATHAAPQPAEPQAERTAPKGWGKAAGNGHAEPAQADDGQRERVSAAIQPAGFTKGVGEQMNALREGNYGEVGQADNAKPAADAAAEPAKPTTRTRRAATANADAVEAPSRIDPAKVEILKIVFADPATTLEEGLELAADMLRWVRES